MMKRDSLPHARWWFIVYKKDPKSYGNAMVSATTRSEALDKFSIEHGIPKRNVGTVCEL